METPNIFIAHPTTTEQADALKAFFKALKIKFEVAEKPYDPDFVAKIEKSKKEFEKGDFIRVEKDDLHQYLGL